MNIIKTIQVIFAGRVQGVGMRFFVNRSAGKFGVKGYVKNVFNGTVQSVMQGEDKILDEFIEYIKRNAPGKIDRLNVTVLDTDKEYKRFQVKLF